MNLFDLFATINLDSKGYEEGIDDVEKKTSTFGSKIKKALNTAAKVSSAAVGAAAAGATAITKSAVDNFADYEQLVGGIETLFGDAAESVMKDADRAFKTAGLSANQYMETSIQSAAALINSLGGDQKKASALMNMSITDMADNVNKMGTSMEAVQNAYRGFSRGNFTMLDNLALGFAGTKEGMQELLDKAEEFSGVKFDISNYSDIVQAINIVQTEMGITGTTAKEAAETISGSASSVRSAWQNLMTGLAADNSDLDSQVSALVESIELTLNNLAPVVERVLGNIGEVITQLAPGLLSMIVSLFESAIPEVLKLAPELIAAGTDALMLLSDVIIDNLPLFVESGLKIIQTLARSFTTNLPEMISAVISGVSEIAIFLTKPETLSMLIGAVLEIVQTLAISFVQNIPLLIDSFMQILDNIITFIGSNLPMFVESAVSIIIALTNGLIDALPILLGYVPTIINSVVDTLINMLPLLVDAGVTLLTALVGNMPKIIEIIISKLPQIISSVVSKLTELIPNIVSAGVKLLTSLVKEMPTIITNIVQKLPKLITSIVIELVKLMPKIVSMGVTLFTSLITDLPKAIVNILKQLPNIIANIVSGLLSGMPDIIDVGKSLIEGLWEGIKSLGGWIWEKATGFVGGLIDGVKSFLGINSPSKVFANIGEMMDRGLVQGIEKYADLAVDAAETMAEDVVDAANPDIDFTANSSLNGSKMGGVGFGAGGAVINVYGAEGQNVNELAEILSQKMALAYSQEQAVWA